jgi:two-component system, sensor histidine kinase PdtaS
MASVTEAFGHWKEAGMHFLQTPFPAGGLTQTLIADSITPLMLLDGNLRVVAVSTSFCETFDVDPAAAGKCSLAELGSGEWNIPQLSSLLKVTASGHARIDGFEIGLTREGLIRRLAVSAKALPGAEQSDALLVMTVCDVADARIDRKRATDLLRQKDVLLQEHHHRIANSLQIIASVLLQNTRKVQHEETRTHLQDAHNRIMSVAALQQQLAASNLGEVELRPYLFALCESIRSSLICDRDRISLEVRADDGIAAANTSAGLGLIVTELVINALKHAFLGNPKGRIVVDYSVRGPNWTLSVGDNGVGMPKHSGKAKIGLGTSLIRALAQQLDAEINVAATSQGTTVSIEHSYMPVLIGQSPAHSNRAA